MRELSEVEPSPATELEIFRHGIWEVATLAPGSHQSDPCYGARREIKDFAVRILEAADATRREA